MAHDQDLFGAHNIPFGVASDKNHVEPRCVTRYQDNVVFLAELAKAGVFTDVDSKLEHIFSQSTLNTFTAMPKKIQQGVRSKLQSYFTSTSPSSFPTNSHAHIDSVRLHLPVQIGDYTDFCASREHNLGASAAIFGKGMLPPGFHHFPIGYHGRVSSMVVSGTPVERPLGQFVDRAAEGNPVVFGPTRALDYELEVAAVVGRPVRAGQRVRAEDADDHIFGLVLMNDWSARDIQGFEMNPLGPFNGKNFATSCSPWIITLDALKPFETPAPPHDEPVEPYLDDANSTNYAISLKTEIVVNGKATTTCQTGFESMYWTFRQMLAHHTVGGCDMRSGDVFASGTVSGMGDEEHGCLLESTMGGKKAVRLEGGGERTYLLDGDIVKLSGVARKEGVMSVGFGECVGEIKAARPLDG